WVLQRSQHFLTSFEPDDVVTAITRNNVINKISIMLSVVGKWIKNRRLTSELVEFLEFVSTVGIYNQKIIRRSVKMALNIRPRFGPQQNWFSFVFIWPLDLLTGHLDG
ncbi:MAG: hypothetical protein WCF75_25485, partial [Pseudolabrys sp.]